MSMDSGAGDELGSYLDHSSQRARRYTEDTHDTFLV
jgi:hypothetical protein